MKYYIAYGSNLNLEQMKWRCPTAGPVGTAIIKDYELLFKGSKTGANLTIEYKKGKEVPVGIWLIDDECERSLDRYEGYPDFYYKEEIPITFREKRGLWVHDKALIYIMHEERLLGIPRPSYVETVLKGYRDFKFNVKYLVEAVHNAIRRVK